MAPLAPKPPGVQNMLKPFAPSLAAAVTVLTIATSAQAAKHSSVNVLLWDKGASADMASDKGIGMSGSTSSATMGVKLSASKVSAGEVTFRVTNASKETIHEMVVLPYKDGQKLPFSEKDGKIDEDSAGHLAEVSELEPGKKGELKIALKPGKYVLVCNVPNHYMNGMWSILTVK